MVRLTLLLCRVVRVLLSSATLMLILALVQAALNLLPSDRVVTFRPGESRTVRWALVGILLGMGNEVRVIREGRGSVRVPGLIRVVSRTRRVVMKTSNEHRTALGGLEGSQSCGTV